MQLPKWLSDQKTSSKQLFEQNPKVSLKYGLTIRLSTKDLDLTQHTETNSEQIITINHENCELHNLFDKLDDPDVKKHLFSTTPAITSPITHFSNAFFDIALLIRVPAHQEAVLDLTRTLQSTAFKAHTLIILEPHAKLTLIDKYQGNPTLHTHTTEVIAKNNSQLQYASIQNLSQESTEFTNFRAHVHKHSQVNWFIASIGSKLSQANVDTHLIGEASETKSYGVFLGNNQQQFDMSSSAFHKGNHSISDMYTRGVLDNKSKAVYRGNIDIDADAFGCNGYQKEETILLSQNAVADAIPNLEIRNNDVKCSHGATIGRVDAEQLFYLTSRGVPETKAIHMIVEGFFEPLTARIKWPELFDILKPLVQEKTA